MNKLLSIAMVILLIAFVSLGVHTAANTTERMQLKDVQLNSTTRNIKTLEIKNQSLHKQLDTVLQGSTVDQEKVKQLEDQIEQTNKQNEELQEQLQAKLEQKRKDQENANIASRAFNAITGTATASAASDKQAMMAAAGISSADYAAVDFIVSHESTWNTQAVNASSGSCGLVQELPCGKSGCTLGDGVCQLKWASEYATSRYGSWWGAYSYWQANRWW